MEYRTLSQSPSSAVSQSLSHNSGTSVQPLSTCLAQSHTHHSLDEGAAFVITSKDASVLQTYIDDFKTADSSARADLVEKVMGELCRLRPSSTSFNKMEAKAVRTIVI
jgi:hypothetical protein